MQSLNSSVANKQNSEDSIHGLTPNAPPSTPMRSIMWMTERVHGN